MEKRVEICFVVFLFAVFLTGFASADFGLGNNSIETQYDSEEFLSGWIEMNFTEESNESVFEDSEGNSISLQSLLVINPEFSSDISGNGEVNSTGLQKLYFDDASFSFLTVAGNFTYQLNFSGEEIFSGEFNISNVTTQETDVNSTINEKLSKIDSLRTKIGEYDLFSQESIEAVLNLSSLEEKINFLKFTYENSNVSEEEILANLSSIEVPDTILRTKGNAEPIPIIPKRTYVDLEKLKETAGGEYEEDYENAVIGWIINNAEIEMSLREYSSISNGSTENILTAFGLDVKRISDTSYPFYVFIEDQDDFVFREDYGEIDGNYYVIEISDDSDAFSFYTEREMSFEDLRFFVAPSLSELTTEDFEVEPFEEEGGFKWVIFVLVIALLFIIGVVVYVFLQVWYKKKYEAYLFKNKNDLYNIANYISVSKKKGMDNNEIIKNLKKAKWSGEQIRYAVRKYSGKRTGMFEIPLEKFIEKEEKKSRYNQRPRDMLPKRGRFKK